MQNFTQKYTLITLLEKINEGTEYPSTHWPLHVTIADTFAVDWSKNDLLKKLSALVANHQPVTAIADHDEYFGPQKQTQVTILDMSKELIALHNDVVGLLKSAGAIFNNPQYIGEGYRAHVTVQSHLRLHKGDLVNINGLTIVDMFPHEDPYQRKILKTISFSE